jgi:endonuclease/exonuclease/phosphatase family metal-dependent hydrolase
MNIQLKLSIGLVISLSSVAHGELPIIDGVFSDWGKQHVVAGDEKDDSTGAFDLTTVAVATSDSELYIHFDIGNIINLQSGADSDGTLCLVVDMPSRQRLTIDFRNRSATLDSEPDQPIPWSDLGFVCLPTFASDRYELRLDLRRFSVRAGDTIQLNFAGSDTLDQPASIVLQKKQERSRGIRFDKINATDVRIANLNTLQQGMSHADRSGPIKRLLAATKADIFCFQEEWDEAKFRKAAAQIVPSTGKLNLHWSGGCAIATSLPLVHIPMKLDRCAAAVIERPDTRPLLVISVHFKCCGFNGSREDITRINQAAQIANEIRRLRDGEFGKKLTDAGVVIIGDYNLVGSRMPLEILKAVGLTDRMLLGMDKQTAFTWRGIKKEESFWPGRLDLVTYDQTVLRPAGGFLLDTNSLSKKSLRDLLLLVHDSSASDHLMLVADFQFR